jgi:hypothetical protein
VYGTQNQGLMRVSPDGGVPEPLTELAEDEATHQMPHYLPGGRTVLFTARRDDGSMEVAVHSLDTDSTKRLVEGSDPKYLADGYLVFRRSGALFVAPFDPDALAILDEAVPVLGGDSGLMLTYRFAVGPEGDLVYVPFQDPRFVLVWVDFDGNEEALDIPPGDFQQVRISPDGSRIAVMAWELDTEQDIWVWDLSRGTPTRLTENGLANFPLWTPDGSAVVFSDRFTAISRRRANGTGSIDEILEAEGANIPIAFAWTDEEQLIYGERSFQPDNMDMRMMRGRATDPPSELLAGENLEGFPALSPNGNWMAYVSGSTLQDFGVYVRPFPVKETDEFHRVSRPAEFGRPFWSRDGRSLFYVGETHMMRVSVEEGAELTLGEPEPLIELSGYRRDPLWVPYDFDPTQERFLFIKRVKEDETEADARRPVLVQNWITKVEQSFRDN